MSPLKEVFYRHAKKVFPQLGLESNGERVDIMYTGHVDLRSMNMYEISHYYRYRYAQSLLRPSDVVGDFACGTGYGAVMLAEKSAHVIGVDLNDRVIKKITQRYAHVRQVEFHTANLLNLNYQDFFDVIVSFETLEHFPVGDVAKLLGIYHRALKPSGRLIFSTPYKQEASPQALAMGFHKTFMIDEAVVKSWMDQHRFSIVDFRYQDYRTHTVETNLTKPDFILCQATCQ